MKAIRAPALERLSIAVEVLVTVIKFVTVALTISFVVVMLAAVWSRYVANNSLIWTEEYIRFSLFWLVFIASALVSYEEGHLRIEVFQNLLPEPVRQVLDLIVKLLVLGFLAILIWQTTELYARSGGRSPALKIPMAWVYAAMIVGGILISVTTIRSILAPRKPDSQETAP